MAGWVNTLTGREGSRRGRPWPAGLTHWPVGKGAGEAVHGRLCLMVDNDDIVVIVASLLGQPWVAMETMTQNAQLAPC